MSSAITSGHPRPNGRGLIEAVETNGGTYSAEAIRVRMGAASLKLERSMSEPVPERYIRVRMGAASLKRAVAVLRRFTAGVHPRPNGRGLIEATMAALVRLRYRAIRVRMGAASLKRQP